MRVCCAISFKIQAWRQNFIDFNDAFGLQLKVVIKPEVKYFQRERVAQIKFQMKINWPLKATLNGS